MAAATEYVLSAYIWHLGDGTHGGRAQLDFNDAFGEPHDGVLGSISIGQSEADANDGYFVYGTFNTADTGTSFDLRVFMNATGLPTTGWPNQPVAAMWDNIAITPASTFVAPTIIPEPSSLLLVVFGLLTLGMTQRRRSR